MKANELEKNEYIWYIVWNPGVFSEFWLKKNEKKSQNSYNLCFFIPFGYQSVGQTIEQKKRKKEKERNNPSQLSPTWCL